MEEIKKPKVTQEMRDAARQTATVLQTTEQISQAREAGRQAEQQQLDSGLER